MAEAKTPKNTFFAWISLKQFNKLALTRALQRTVEKLRNLR